jgi:hypothetical protein
MSIHHNIFRILVRQLYFADDVTCIREHDNHDIETIFDKMMDTVNNGLGQLWRLFTELPTSSLVALVVFVGPVLVCQNLRKNNGISIYP